VINLTAYALALALSQEDAPPAVPLEQELAKEAAQQQEGGTAPGPGTSAPVAPSRPKGTDEIVAAMKKMPTMKPEDQKVLLERLRSQFGHVTSNPVLPTDDIDLVTYLALSPNDQALVVARGFFNDVIHGDATELVARSGFPFFMESRRVDRSDDLLSAWSRSLRTRRTDLLKLYSVEVMTPAEMEKKYGKPPARLAQWPLKSPNTFVAVGNLSGHATIVLLRQAGAAWQVVAFHD
jgi:hypothetical protein